MRIAVVGIGRMGRRHIQAIGVMGLELVGICDSSQASLELAFKENGVIPSKHFTDYETMLKETRPECVIVATTAPTHCEYTCMAAANGAKFILCEKPMAVSLKECDRMIASCHQAGASLAINHQMRFMEQYIEPKKILQDELGGLVSVAVLAGNFGLAMNGIHYFEMFRYLTDETPQEVTAWFSSADVSNPRGLQFKDKAGTLRLTTASGKRFYMDASDDQGHGMQVVYAARYGQLMVDELAGLMHWVVREKQYRSLPLTRYGMPWLEHTRKITPVDVIEPSKAVLNALLEKKNYPTGEDGRRAVATLIAAYVSNENKHMAVQIDDRLPSTRIFPWA